MRQIAQGVLEELGLNYRMTFVSVGESGRVEIVLFDPSHDRYFPLGFVWRNGEPAAATAAAIRAQLLRRLDEPASVAAEAQQLTDRGVTDRRRLSTQPN